MNVLYRMLIAAVFGISASAWALQADSSHISIQSPWARASAPGAPSAGFLVIANDSDLDDVLQDVTGDFGKRFELHRTMQQDGVMRMVHQAQGIVIPANSQVVFKPGSYHLMFMGLDKAFELGESYSVQLHFERAGVIEVSLPVRQGKMGGDMNHKMNKTSN